MSLHASLATAHEDAGIPAISACVYKGETRLHDSAHGGDPEGRETTPESLFDVASLTKLMATTTTAAVMVGRGLLDLDTPVVHWLPEFGQSGKGAITPRALLGHRSGLAAWSPFFKEVMNHQVARGIYPWAEGESPAEAFSTSRRLVLSSVLRSPPAHPAGTRVYSDLGFLTLMRVLERASNQDFRHLVQESVLDPLGLQDTFFHDLGSEDDPGWPARHVMPTGLVRPRPPLPEQDYSVPPQADDTGCGEVDDDNAFALGGVAGHAGLFSTARDVARFGALVLEEMAGADRLGAGEALRSFAKEDPATTGCPRGLGFDMPAPENSTLGTVFGSGPQGAVGHLGFTGCALWLDLDRGLSAALLTNRVFPDRGRQEEINNLRRDFYDKVAQLP